MGDDTLLLLNRREVESFLDPDPVAEAVRDAFVLHSGGEGRTFPMVRETLVPGGVFGIKSGDVPKDGLLGYKSAGFWPANRAAGAEPHQATIVLVAMHTGRPVAILDGNGVTTARTGAAGAIGLSLLARPDSTRLSVFGTGVQARVQVALALRQMPGLTSVLYLTSTGARAPAFEAAFGDRCRVAHATDPNRAVAGSDIVVTATPGGGALFDGDAVRPGTHLNCVGADTRGKRELPGGLLARARLFADDRRQSRAVGEGQWHAGAEPVEVGALLSGAAAVARRPEDVTVFDMTGLALQDLTVAAMVLRRARHAGIGTAVAWPW